MNRRERAEESYRKKFNEFGLSERFEFLRREWSMDHDKRFWCRCRTCGKEFLSWNEVFRGRQKHLLCPNCGAASDGNDVWDRSPVCESAMAYYAEGHTVKETAEKFSISEYQINNSVKARGLSNGRRFGELSDGYKESVRKESEQNIAKRLNSLGFDYIGGYVDRHGKVRIKCKSCGNTFERTADFAKKGNVVCRKCEHEKVIVRQARCKEERAEESKQKAIERKRNKERVEAEKADALFHLLNDKTHICSVCGKHFSISEFMESKGRTLIPTDPRYCSQKCNRKAMNKARKKAPSGRTGNYYKRARKYGCEYSTGITLKKLVARDGLKCRICGDMCDWDDHSWTEYSGPMYPSIDHIIPMSKGGGHVWDNVQVAHIICNSEKGDSI
jgi:5-methylcytosine-specific restriction endonuclease McrA